jgi:hypothetical protein
MVGVLAEKQVLDTNQQISRQEIRLDTYATVESPASLASLALLLKRLLFCLLER